MWVLVTRERLVGFDLQVTGRFYLFYTHTDFDIRRGKLNRANFLIPTVSRLTGHHSPFTKF